MMRLLPAWLLLIPFVVVFIAFQLAPLGWIMVSAFQVDGNFGFGNFNQIFDSPFYRQAIWRSVEISLASSLLGLTIAAIACHCLTRTNGALRRWMIAFSNMTSNFAGVPLAFAFIILLGSNGVLTLLLQRVGLIDSFSLYSRHGLMIIYTWFQIPLGMLLLFPAFEGLRSDWRDAASLLGAGRVNYWRYIGLPVLMPALLGTLSILIANAMGAYATVYALVNTNYNLLTIRISNLVSGDLFLQPNLASALALLLVGLLVIVTLIQQWILRRSYHVAKH